MGIQSKLFLLFMQKMEMLDEITGQRKSPVVLLYPDLSGRIKIHNQKPIFFESLEEGIIKIELWKLDQVNS